MAKRKKEKDGFMSLVLICFVLFCAIKIVGIQREIANKETQLAELNQQIQQQENKNKDIRRQLEVGSEEENMGRVAFEQYGYGHADEHVYIDGSGS